MGTNIEMFAVSERGSADQAEEHDPKTEIERSGLFANSNSSHTHNEEGEGVCKRRCAFPVEASLDRLDT